MPKGLVIDQNGELIFTVYQAFDEVRALDATGLKLAADDGTLGLTILDNGDLLVGDGKTVYGGTGSLEELTLQGTSNANLGFITMSSPVKFTAYTNNPNAAYAFDYSAAEPNRTTAFVGGGLNMSGSILFSHSTFIYESFRGAPTITTAVSPGFAAYTVMQALPTLKAGAIGGMNPLSPLFLNAGGSIESSWAGTRTTGSVSAVNFAPALKALVSGATMNVTNWIGMTVAPTWHTVSGGIINFGNITGLWCKTPAQNLFGSSAGVERLNTYVGVKVENITLNSQFGTAFRCAVQSFMTAGNNKWFLVNSANAPSNFGASNIYFADFTGPRFGFSANGDANIGWESAGYLFINFITGAGGHLAFSSATPDSTAERFLISAGGASNELTLNFERFSLGANAGVVGNQVGLFTAPTRTTLLNGDWSDFLLTQAGNITLDHTMGRVFGWTVNAPSITIGTGSVLDAGALLIGGNVNQGTNRYGLYIISNPSGGGGVNHGLRVAGSVQFDDDLIFTGESSGLPFGGIYAEDNAAQTAIAVTLTWYQVTVFDTNDLSNNTTPDHTNDHVTIIEPGKYYISVSASILSVAGPGATFECEVKTNNGAVAHLNIHWDRALSGGGGDVGSTSMSGFADLAAGDTVEVWVQNKTGTENIIFEDISLSVIMVGGT